VIKVTVFIDREEGVVATEAIPAASIREAVSVAKKRYPKEDVRVAFPIDPETFFLRSHSREPAHLR
jgi:hypothetical protein